MTGNTHAKPAVRRTPPPRPPTAAERAAAAHQRARHTRRDGGDGGVMLAFVVGVLLLAGAFAAYLAAVHSVDIDNPFMRGDQSHAANYAPTIALAAAGAFMLLVAAIIDGGRRR